MNRALLEQITASLVVFLTTIFTLGAILVVANAIFQWDLFPPSIEKLIYFLGFVTFAVTVASAVVNVMLNISRFAFFAQKMMEKLYDKPSEQ